MITRPLLAATLEDVATLKFPVLATPKLDGIRVLKVNGKAVTRKFKPIPNTYIRRLLEKHLPDGIDGEIMTPGTFNDIQSKVMSFDGEPEFTFYAFDYVKDSLTKPYKDRMLDMVNALESVVKDSTLPFSINLLTPVLVRTMEELLELESQCLEHGFEGVMIRQPDSKYKCGRSTPKEQILMKLKRFMDAEARVIDFEEKMQNDNVQERDEFGLAKRSSKKEGLIPANTLGSLIVEDLNSGVRFGIGSGFDDELKREIWINRTKYKNKIVKYKYQSVGAKDAPRFPVFLGFRSELDL
jgi:DNA ligase-1